MKFCKNCGIQLEDENSKFCPNCGIDLRQKLQQNNDERSMLNSIPSIEVWRIHEIVRGHTFKDRPKN